MLEPLDIKNLALRIDSDGNVTLDIQVGEQWRRVIRTFHAGYTHYCCGRVALEIGDGTKDVTAEYQELENDKEGQRTREQLETELREANERIDELEAERQEVLSAFAEAYGIEFFDPGDGSDDDEDDDVEGKEE